MWATFHIGAVEDRVECVGLEITSTEFYDAPPPGTHFTPVTRETLQQFPFVTLFRDALSALWEEAGQFDDDELRQMITGLRTFQREVARGRPSNDQSLYGIALRFHQEAQNLRVKSLSQYVADRLNEAFPDRPPITAKTARNYVYEARKLRRRKR